MNFSQKLKFAFALSVFCLSVGMASPTMKGELGKSSFTLENGESSPITVNAPVQITNNSSVTSSFSVMLLTDVLDGGLTGETISEDHVSKTWVIQSTSSTSSGSGINIELEWDVSEEVGIINSYDVIYFDESTSAWKALSGTMGSVQTSSTTKTISISNVTTDFTDPVMLAVAPMPVVLPTISGFSSNRVDPGSSITISGSGFSTTTSDNIVFFGPKKASITASTATQLTVTVPNGAGTGLVRYTNLNSGLTTVSSEYFIATNSSLSGKNLSQVSLTPGLSVSAVAGNGTWYERGVIIAAEDFDGDGNTDILKGGTNNAFVIVRNTNTSPGSISTSDFASPHSVVTTGNVTEVATGDLDGDGKIDVVTASTGGTVTAILNNSTSGNLSFGQSNSGANDADFQTVYVQYEANRVSLADVDVDGKLDLVVMGYYSSKFYVFLNTSTVGNLSFNQTPVQISPTGVSGARQMSVGDVNMDGKVDVIIGVDSGSKFKVCLNTSSGAGNVAFASTFDLTGGGTGRASVVDVNGDGKNDIVGDGEAIFVNGDSDGIYVSSDFTRVDDIIDDFDAFTPFADLNGDGKIDFVGDGGWTSGRLSQNNSTTTAISTSSFAKHYFSLSIQYMESIVLVDLDNDNKIDYVASSGSNSNVEVKRNRVGETISVYPKDNHPNYNEWYESLSPLAGQAPNSAVDIPEFEFNWSNPSYSTLNWYYSSTFEGSHVFSNTIVALSSDLKINGPMTGYSSSAYVKTSSSNGLVRPVASSEVEFPVGGSTYGLVRVTNQNSTSDVFEVNAFDGVYQSGGTYGTKGYNTIDRTWIVNKASANGSGGVDLSFNWDINDNVNGTVTTPALYTFDGSSWTKVTNSVTTTGTSITVSGYTGTLSNRKFAIGNDSYGFVAPPSISSYSAYSGPSGHSFYISGSGFTGVTSVTIGGDPVSSFTVDSDTKISIVAGPGTTGQIQAISGAGTGTGSRTFTFNPSITITGSVGAIDKCANQASAAQTVNVSGQNLINSLWVNSATGLEYSSDGGSTWTTVLAFSPTSGVVNKDIEIRARSNQNSALSTRSIVVSSASATSQNISYSVGILPNTMISTQPSDESACINSTETISVAASGSGLTYQWFSNTTNSNTGGTSLGAADGAQTSTLTVSTSAAGTTYYYCEVSGTCGDVTSDVSEVAIYPASVAGTASAANTTLCPGNPAVLTLSGATGDIQWQSSADNSTWSDITGATSASYTSPNLQDDMYYRAVSTTGCDASTSNVVTISVTGPAPYLYDRTVNFSSSHYLYSAPTTTLNLDGSSSFTVEAWINPTDFSNSSAGIVSKGNAFSLKTESNGRLSFIVEQSWSWERLASSDNAITLNEWQHVAASYDGSTRVMKLYIDGQLVTSMTRSQSFSPNFTSSNFQIGRNISGNGGSQRDFNGNIDEVKLWNVVKSDADISNDYATQLTGSESNLMAYYTFDQGEGGADNSGLTGITDISGNGNDLSFSSGMTLDGSSSNIIQTGPAIIGNLEVCLGESYTYTHTTGGGTWSTSDAAVCSIDASTGVLNALSVGSAVITNTYSFNGCDYTSSRTVTLLPLPVITGDAQVPAGEQITLTATTTAASSNAWVSSDVAVATVDASGEVTGQSIGTATITYTNENGCIEDHALSVIVGTTQAPALTSPASNITGATTFAVTYTLAETPLSGSVKLTFSPTDGGTPIVWTMGDATSVSFNYDVNTTPSNSAISSGALLPYDTYDVELSYQDAYSNPAATATNTNIQTLAPPAISYSPANYAYVLGASVTTVTPANTGGMVASWSVSPSLPAGITFSTSTGEISGTASTLAATTTYTVTATNLSGTSTADVVIVVDNDTDGDGIPDEADVDVDGDGVNDNGTDTDGDGINNTFDDDIDGDGIPNDTDPDIDGDGIPNGSDVDPDGDGVNDNGTDTDGDGVNDANDTDIDGDGIANSSDACPTIINTAITSQPSSASEDICPSGTLSTLSVTAVGENLTYQWYVNNVGGNSTGTAVTGATSATYAPASLVGPSYYYVEVSGDCGVLNSSASGALYARDIIAPTVVAVTSFTAELDANGTYTITESDIITSKSDNCTAVPTISLTDAVYRCSDAGVAGLTVTWTATDDEGNVSTGSVPVTVVDLLDPIMGVQNVTVQMDASGNSSVSTSQVDDGTTDNCSFGVSFDATSSVATLNFVAADLGANTVTLYATDASNNQSSSTATVTVVDQISPVVNTQNVTVYLDANGAASITTSDIDNGTTDNSGQFTLTLDNTSFDCDDLGTNTVVLTATDVSGNTSNSNATVTVVDNTIPVLNITNSYAILGADGTVTLTQNDISGTVIDNCDVTWTFSTATFDCSMLGANIITVTATDASGNTTNDEIVVTIADNTAPLVALQPVTLTLDANGTATLDTAMVIDYVRENCSVSSMSLSQTTFNCSDLGDNTITLTVIDSEGNSTAQTATVTVTDAAAPVAATQDITLALDANGAASMSYLDVEDGSTDNCGIESYAIDATNFTCADLGVNWVVLTVTDAAGNTDTAWSRVTVVDQLDPVALVQPFTVALDASGAASISASDVNAGSYDNCSGVSVAIDVSSFTCADLGANTVTLTATDASGNATSVATTVTVVDNTAPVVALQPVTLTLDANGTATLDTAAVIDYVRENCSVSSMSLSQTTFNCSDLGANTITLTVIDSEGNSTAQTATVTVTDAAAPMILMPSMLTVYANALCQATATWSTSVMDNCSASWSSNYASGSTFGVGQHDVITIATDASGNTTVDTMLVSVIDTVAPIFTSQPFVSSMVPGPGCSAYVTWVNPMAVDWCSSNSVSSNVLSGSLFTSGTHTVVFTATDDNQNTRSMTLTFTVNDGVAPVATVPSTVIATNDPGTCGAVVNLPIPSGTDNCGVDTAYYSIASGSVFPVGITPVTITVIDFDGNMDQGVFNVEVQDTEKPVFTNVPTDTVLGYCNSALAYSLPSATDNCGISSVNLISGIAPGNIFPAGQTKNIFQVTDVHGNSDTVSFTVFVSNQSTAPTPMFGSICENESPFDLRQGDTSYAFWGDYIDDNIFDPGLAGAGNTMVYYSWTDSLGCTSLGQLNLFIDAAPDLPIVQRSSSTYLTVNMAYARYQWLKNGIAIPGATNRDFIVTSSGYYRVKVWNAAGCDETSAPMPVGTVGLDEAVLSDITIYPNPSTGQFNLDLTKIQSEVQVAIYDGVGKQVYRGSAKNELVQIDLSGLASGMYHIVLRDAEGASVTKRVSIQK